MFVTNYLILILRLFHRTWPNYDTCLLNWRQCALRKEILAKFLTICRNQNASPAVVESDTESISKSAKVNKYMQRTLTRTPSLRYETSLLLQGCLGLFLRALLKNIFTITSNITSLFMWVSYELLTWRWVQYFLSVTFSFQCKHVPAHISNY